MLQLFNMESDAYVIETEDMYVGPDGVPRGNTGYFTADEQYTFLSSLVAMPNYLHNERTRWIVLPYHYRGPIDAAAFINTKTGVIIHDSQYALSSDYRMRANSYHEGAHGLDYQRMDETSRYVVLSDGERIRTKTGLKYSDTKRFQDIYDKERNYLIKFLRLYPDVSVWHEEYFAESMTHFHLKPEDLKKGAPLTYQYMREIDDYRRTLPNKDYDKTDTIVQYLRAIVGLDGE